MGCTAKPSAASAIRQKFAQDGLVSRDFIKQQLPQAEELFVFQLTSALNSRSPGILDEFEREQIEDKFGKKYADLLRNLQKRSPFLARFKQLADQATQWCFSDKCEKEKQRAAENLRQFEFWEAIKLPVEEAETFLKGAMVLLDNSRIAQDKKFIYGVFDAARKIRTEKFQITLFKELVKYYQPFLWVEDSQLRRDVVTQVCELGTTNRDAEEAMLQKERRDYALDCWWETHNDGFWENKYKTLAQENPNDPFYQFTAGYFLAQHVGKKEGSSYLEKAVSLAPKNLVYRDKLISYYLGSSENEKAIPHLKEMVALTKENEDYLSDLGDIYMGRNKLVEAIDVYEKAAKKNSKYYFELGNAYLQKGEKEKAKEAFQKYFSYNFNSRRFTFRTAGDIFSDKKFYPEAIEYSKKSLEYDPNNADAWNTLGDRYKEVKGWDQAVAAYETAARIKGGDADANTLRKIAEVYEKQKNTDKRIETFEKLIKLKEATADDHFHLGEIFENQREMDEALLHFQEAVRLDQNSNVKLERVIENLYNLEKYQEALVACAKGEKLFPKDAFFPWWAGDIYTALKKFPEAQTAYQKALKFTKDSAIKADTLKSLGEMYEMAYAKYPEAKGLAIQTYQKALKLDPQNPALRAKLAAARKLKR